MSGTDLGRMMVRMCYEMSGTELGMVVPRDGRYWPRVYGSARCLGGARSIEMPCGARARMRPSGPRCVSLRRAVYLAGDCELVEVDCEVSEVSRERLAVICDEMWGEGENAEWSEECV
eukprot:1243111-Rhodomonas_salina.6